MLQHMMNSNVPFQRTPHIAFVLNERHTFMVVLILNQLIYTYSTMCFNHRVQFSSNSLIRVTIRPIAHATGSIERLYHPLGPDGRAIGKFAVAKVVFIALKLAALTSFANTHPGGQPYRVTRV